MILLLMQVSFWKKFRSVAYGTLFMTMIKDTDVKGEVAGMLQLQS